MWRARTLLPGLLLLATCRRQPSLDELRIAETHAALERHYDRFAPDAIAQRLARLRPHVEAVLGAPIDDPGPVACLSRDMYAGWLAARAIDRADDPDREERQRIRHTSRANPWIAATLGFVFEDDVTLLPDNFLHTPEAQRDAMLDVVLAHELVHVYQEQRFDLDVYTEAVDGEAEDARCAAIEGHAQFVARRVASRIGASEAFDLLVRSPAVDGLTAFQIAEMQQQNLQRIFRYIDGERFFAAVAAELGEATALDRVFADPPATHRHILDPAGYLAGARTPELDLRPVLEEHGTGDGGTVTLLPSAVRLHAGEAADAMVRAGAIGLKVARGALQGWVQVYAIRCASEDDAGAFVAAVRRRAESEGDRAIYPDAVWRVARGEYRTLPDGTFHASRIVRSPFDLRPAQTIVLRRGGLVLELNAPCGPEDTPFLARLGSRILDTLAGAAPAGAPARVRTLLARDRGKWALTAPLANLTALLADPDAEARATAVMLVRDDESDKARRFLEGAKEHADPAVRSRAVALLGARDGTDVSGALADPDASVRLAAVTALAERGWFANAPNETIDALFADPDARVRAATLAGFDDVDEKPAAKIARLTRDPDPLVRGTAWNVRDDDPTNDEVARGLADPDPYVRSEVFWAIDVHGDDAGERVHVVLAAALEDPDPYVRLRAYLRLMSVGDEAADLVPQLTRALEDDETRHAALSLLEDIDTPAAKAAVARCVLDPDSRANVLAALDSYEPARPLLDEARRDWDPLVRLEAAVARRRPGDSADEIVSLALALLASDSPSWRAVGVLETLADRGDLGGHEPRLRAGLLAAMDADEELVRSGAIDALVALEATDAEVVAAIVARLRDEGKWVVRAAVRAVAKIGESARAAVPDLVALLEHRDDDSPSDEDDIAEALGAIGPDAAPALPALRKLLDDEDEWVRRAAEEAIGAIES